jgi:hypothetical protein
MPAGEVLHNPFRVIPHDKGGELVFVSCRRGMAAEDFARDSGLLPADLHALRRIVESR